MLEKEWEQTIVLTDGADDKYEEVSEACSVYFMMLSYVAKIIRGQEKVIQNMGKAGTE